jgi:Ca2+-binding EF-hand superfamily protein
MQYNQTEKGQVRIGNWLEELKLKEDTGIRFYPDPNKKENGVLSKARCIVHTDQMNPRDYISTTQLTLREPKKDPTYLVVEKVGPRYKRFENTIKAEIEENLKTKSDLAFQESRRLSYATETKDFLQKQGFTPSLKENDYRVRVPTKTSSYSTDTAVTIYSHAVSHPAGKVDFPMTFVGAKNPFLKNTSFSADIKREDIALRTETSERPMPLTTVTEFKSLMKWRNRLIQHIRTMLSKRQSNNNNHHYSSNTSNSKSTVYMGAATIYLIGCFSSFLSSSSSTTTTNNNNNNNDNTMSITEFDRLLFNQCDSFQCGPNERYALLSALDRDSSGFISVPELISIIKQPLTPHRVELIKMFYTELDNIQEGYVRFEYLQERYSTTSTSPSTATSLGATYRQALMDFVTQENNEDYQFQVITFDDFYLFFSYVASEIETEDQFEMILKQAWEIEN